MNPMNRRMFRDPMMAKRVAGILASSPELMAAAQKKMNSGGVIKAANGTSVRTGLLNSPAVGQYTAAVQKAISMGDKRALQELAKPVNYGAAARTPDGKAALAMAGQALGSFQKAEARVETVEAPEAQQPLSDIMAGIMSQADASIAAEAAKFPGQTGFDKDMESTKAPPQPNPSFQGPLSNNPFFLPTTGFDIDMENTEAMPVSTNVTRKRGDRSRGVTDPAAAGAAQQVQDFISNIIGSRTSGSKATARRSQEEIERKAADAGEDIDFTPTTFVADMGDDGQTTKAPQNVLTTGADLVEAPRGAGESLSQTVIKPEDTDAEGGDDPSDDKPTKPVNKKVVPPANKSSLDDAEDQENQPQIVLTPDAANKITSNDPDVSNDAAQTTGNALVDKALSILQGSGTEDKSEKEKAEAVDDVVGITGKTREERVRKRKQLLKDMLGEREKDIRTDANYNLIMTGLMVAAGESPDAMTNLAKGLAVGFKGYGDAIGEEAKAITKEDRELTIQAFSEVGAEISAEEAAAIKASENALTRAHESKMQNTRLATGLIQAAAQIGSRENIANMQISSNEQMALAKIRSSEMLAANTLEQNANIFNVSTEQKERLAADANALKERLADLPSAEMRKVEAIQADVLKATGEELSTLDAFAALSAATASTKSPTDTQIAYGRLIDAGMKPADAFVFSQSGVLKSIFSELGPEEAQNLIISKMNQGQQGQTQNSAITIADLPEAQRNQISKYKPGQTFPTKQGNYLVTDAGTIVPVR